MITTGYVLPFRFVYTSGVLASGQPAWLHLRLKRLEAADELAARVEAFALLGASGALCGAGIHPARSTLALRREASTSADELRWRIVEASLCEEALVVLAHLLYAADDRAVIDLVEVVEQGTATAPVQLAHDPSQDSTYPALFHAPPFQVDDHGPEGGDCFFEIDLQAALDPRHENWLNLMLEAWAQVVTLGGFGMAPVPPQEGYVEPDEQVTAWDAAVEWSFFKLRADEESTLTVLNGLASFAFRCQGIRRVSLS